MKNLLSLFIVILIQNCFFHQNLFSIKKSTIISIDNNYKQIDTLSHDLILIKPLINLNDSNGGYYSEYYLSSYQNLYCGAIVQNIGSLSSNQVYLKVSFLDYINNVTSIYYSDTIPVLNPNQIETIKIHQTIIPDYYWNSKISYEIKSATIDENEVNNVDTIPFTMLYGDMWSQVSRSNVPTNTLNINQIANFHSGDFLGITLKFPNGNHYIASFGIYMNGFGSDSVSAFGKIYQNKVLIDSFPIYNLNAYQYWINTGLSFPGINFVEHDSIYYLGVQVIYPNGTNFPIGIDTSSFHNFETETIAKIGNTWTTLNFVPLIQIICDPELVQNVEKNSQIQIFPNPSNRLINILNIENSKIEIYDLIGKLLITDYSYGPNKSIDLSLFSEGNYIVKIINKQEIINKKINIMK